jgi:signal transduction histidine kinase
MRRDPKNTQLEYLNGIKQSSDSLLVIINDILDISKIEAGKITLEKEPFSVNELLDNVATDHAVQSGRKRPVPPKRYPG